ncbi:MAG: AAA family ATPase [Candidatus Dormibacteria bacterium]
MSTLRVTVAGKGGVGKTVVSASLARFFGREGHRVLAVDGDSNPVLGISLGVPLERIAEREPIPTDFWVAVERLGEGRVAVLVDDPVLLTERHGLIAPDNVTLLAAPVEVNEGCTADSGVRSMLGVMLGKNSTFDRIITDFEAGIDEPAWALGGFFNPADVLVVVATPNPISMKTAHTIIRFAREAEVPRVVGVANQLTSDRDRAEVEGGFEAVDVECLARVPFDPTIAASDAAGASPLDAAPLSPGLVELRELALRLERDAAVSAG